MSSVDIVEISENEDSDCVLDSLIYENNIEIVYKETCENNPLLADLIETCFNLDNSPEMKKVSRYSHKFSHIKDLCEILRSGNTKKRVQLITLSNNIKDNEISQKRKSETERNSKKQKTEVIDLDSTENDLIIDLDSNDCYFKSDYTSTGEKENDTCNENRSIDEDKLLVPHRILEVQERSPIDDNNIIRIEQKIETYEKIIAQLEEQEVCDDNMNSPYIQCENYKARIVTLYKELCKLTGAEAVKRSIVHLKVMEGHPLGPVRRLEAFLNKNVGSDGHPPFPSFRDVVKCVLKANEEDDLGWSKQKIMNEATALFAHCGQALQRRRKRREWRHLVSKVKVERDPADSDPALRARLEQNRRDAARKEAELLERFTMMQNAPSQKAAVSNQEANAIESSNESDIDSSSDEFSTKDETDVDLPSKTSNSSNNNNGIDAGEVNSQVAVVKIKKEFSVYSKSDMGQLLEELGDNYTTSIMDIEDSHTSHIVIEISDSSDEDSDN